MDWVVSGLLALQLSAYLSRWYWDWQHQPAPTKTGQFTQREVRPGSGAAALQERLAYHEQKRLEAATPPPVNRGTVV